MTLGLATHTGSTRLAVVLNEFSELRPHIFAAHKFNGLVLTVMSSEDMIMFETEYTEAKISVVGDVDAAVEAK